MIKKIVSPDGINKISKKVKNLKELRQQSILKQKRDTFELSNDTANTAKKPYPSDCNNLEFKIQKIEFFPEDIKKMEKMSLDERIEYKRKLKEQEKYTVIEDTED